MKLIATYNVWADGLDLLEKSVDNILPVVDQVLIVFSNTSNFGQHIPFTRLSPREKVAYVNLEPFLHRSPHENECDKRNFGLKFAKEQWFTHFINMDSDEFYEQDKFSEQKELIESKNLAGMVCGTKVYFKLPTLCVDDHTLVPFIHKVTPEIKFQLGAIYYPFAYDSAGHAHIDPTRRLNITQGVEMSDIIMHHQSWIRSDFNLKIENSAARNNLKKSSIYKDLENAAPGVYNEFYRKQLQECENIFNI